MSSSEIETPFLLGLVDLEGDLGRLTARIEEAVAEDLSIGMPVRLRFGAREAAPACAVVPDLSDEAGA